MTDSDSVADKTKTAAKSDDATSDLTAKTAAEQTLESAGEEDAVAREPKASALKAAEKAMVSDSAASQSSEGDAASEDAKTEAAEEPKPVPAAPPLQAESSFGKAGQEQKVKHFDTDESRESCRAIFEDGPYRWPEGFKALEVIMDIGAYVGASTLVFAWQFPSATVHAYESCSASRALMTENVAGFTNVKVHEEAIWDKDQVCKLHDGKADPLFASLVPSTSTRSSGEEVKARHADEALGDLNLARSDAVKISTGDSEVAILQALVRHMEATPIIYINYRSETDQRRIDLIMCATHMLLAGTIESPHRGQLCYGLRRVIDPKTAGDKDAVRLHRTPHK